MCMYITVYLYVYGAKLQVTYIYALHRYGLVVRVSASHAIGCGLAPQLGQTKGHHKNGTNCHPAWHADIRVGV